MARTFLGTEQIARRTATRHAQAQMCINATSIMLEQAGAKSALADAQQKAQQILDADVALMK